MINSWLRLYAEFATDPKIQMLSEAMQRRFVMLLCVRCNGHVTLQDEEVTFTLRISPEEWAETKRVFLAKNLITKANEIINWDKRQFRSDSSRERVAKFREKQKYDPVTGCNVTVTPQIQNRTDTEQINLLGSPSTSEDDQKPKKNKSSSSKGTRLPADWTLSDELGEWAEQHGMKPVDILNERDKFRDYWVSKSGAGGTKCDWDATWKNWIRNHLERKQINGIRR